jgi:hypothetical protein
MFYFFNFNAVHKNEGEVRRHRIFYSNKILIKLFFFYYFLQYKYFSLWQVNLTLSKLKYILMI